MSNFLQKHWPLWASLFILWIITGILFLISYRNINFVYSIDDPYIHMAIARNFVEYGVWGVTRYEFSSSSSSLLWTFLISIVYRIFSVNEITPLILNIFFATLLIVSVYLIFKNQVVPQSYIFYVLIGIILATPLVFLIFLGMEHILQTLIVVVFIYLAAGILSKKEFTYSRADFALWALTPLVILIRYEGLFLIFVVCILYIYYKRWIYSIFLGVLALLPIIIYGAISIAKGWYWLPNSVILKGSMPALSNATIVLNFMIFLFKKQMIQILMAPHLVLLVILICYLYVSCGREPEKTARYRIMAIIFVAVTFLHLQFARTGWLPGLFLSFSRYEAYLVTTGIVIVAFLLFAFSHSKSFQSNKHRFLTGLALLTFGILIAMGVESVISVPRAIANIYEQQYQMARFLNRFYSGQVIGANDIGAINYFADIKCLDLWGLGSMEVAELKRDNNYTSAEIFNLAKKMGMKVAVVYDSWFAEYGGIPQEWIRVARWRIKNNLVCGDDTVSFYAVAPGEERQLRDNLRNFAVELPPGVKQLWSRP